jgi:hypothetical protein
VSKPIRETPSRLHTRHIEANVALVHYRCARHGLDSGSERSSLNIGIFLSCLTHRVVGCVSASGTRARAGIGRSVDTVVDSHVLRSEDIRPRGLT